MHDSMPPPQAFHEPVSQQPAGGQFVHDLTPPPRRRLAPPKMPASSLPSPLPPPEPSPDPEPADRKSLWRRLFRR
ncbi:hypothetical protein [Amycolatopsis pithecellobii]|uniref:Uncharacterized protein n=1 Tax=Amycolatopsis pithecellobii TaxID=664692 RepID=A0A6N7Z854_9PSEU|nr:hypothetical protein [Amycolatopsis pithecellobii]MTD57550.1 hypothetical protein [Amycolatopsis pithecellobii]